MLDHYLGLRDFRDAAERLLPRHIWDYIDGAAHDERVADRNERAFEALTLRPRYLRDVGQPELATTLLGTAVELPLFLSPAAFQSNVHPEGEVATSRGAGRAGALTIVPALSGRFGAVAESAPGPVWLQVYHRGRETTEAIVREAEAVGYRAIVPTVDVPRQNPKERDRRNWFLPPYDGVRYAQHEEPFPELPAGGSPFTWADLEWLRGVTDLPIVLKGIMTAEDAQLAVERGAAGVLVSNHGGRLLDATMSAVEALPEVLDAVDGAIEVYVDGGVRRGSDVLKALALGARAVGIGRPWFWGLAVAGDDGVQAVVETLRRELEVTLALCGQHSVLELEPGLVDRPWGWGRDSQQLGVKGHAA